MKRIGIFILFASLIVIVGCAMLTPGFSKEERLQTCLKKGLEYEQKDNLIQASKQYEKALRINPGHSVANKRYDRLNIKLRESAERHYRAGLKYHKEGKYLLARQEFLRTLRLWPDHPNAGKMLRAERQSVKAKKFIVHTIKPGESISKLAMIYYGDYFKFPIIAEYNNLSDATRVRVGQKIKVPEIEGVPFFPPRQDVESERVQVVKEVEREEDQGIEEAIERPVDQAEAAEKEAVEQKAEEKAVEQEIEEIEEPFDAVASCRDLGIVLFNQDKYQEAIVEFNKVVKENPGDEVAVEYLYKAHFRQGMGLFEKKDYLSAKEEFETSLRFNGDCLKCREYIKKSEDTYKEIHYERGVGYFGKELLNKAVREWEMVQAVDPDYKNVKHNINKAKTLLKRLEEIKEHTDKSG